MRDLTCLCWKEGTVWLTNSIVEMLVFTADFYHPRSLKNNPNMLKNELTVVFCVACINF